MNTSSKILSVISTLVVLASGPSYAKPLIDIDYVDGYENPDSKEFPDPNKTYRPGKDTSWPKSPRFNREVALTFDDGPDGRLTPKVLDVLKKYNAKGTFFILTSKINAKTKPIIKRMLEEGHSAASHGVSHYNSNSISESKYKKNLKDSINAIEDLTDELGFSQKEMFYRFPYGAFGRGLKNKYHHLNTMKAVSNEVYGENCINYAMWDIDTIDWVSDMTPQKVAQNIIANIEGGTYYVHAKKNGKWVSVSKRMKHPRGGGVALLHDVKSKDIKALEIFLEYAKENAVDIVSLKDVETYKYDTKVCERINK